MTVSGHNQSMKRADLPILYFQLFAALFEGAYITRLRLPSATAAHNVREGDFITVTSAKARVRIADYMVNWSVVNKYCGTLRVRTAPMLWSKMGEK